MKKAFTLVEIMVVVGIIAILATLSLSLMLRNRITTNETLAVASCRTVVSACQSFYAANLPHTYPDALATLGNPGAGPSYLDTTIATGARSGYTFTYTLVNPVSFTLNADPQFPGRTGNRYFYTDETGRITAKEGGQAGPGDPSV